MGKRSGLVRKEGKRKGGVKKKTKRGKRTATEEKCEKKTLTNLYKVEPRLLRLLKCFLLRHHAQLLAYPDGDVRSNQSHKPPLVPFWSITRTCVALIHWLIAGLSGLIGLGSGKKRGGKKRGAEKCDETGFAVRT